MISFIWRLKGLRRKRRVCPKRGHTEMFQYNMTACLAARSHVAPPDSTEPFCLSRRSPCQLGMEISANGRLALLIKLNIESRLLVNLGVFMFGGKKNIYFLSASS